MSPEEMRQAALANLESKYQVPYDSNGMPKSKPSHPPMVDQPKFDPFNRPAEQGINETSGTDILREPKEAAMKALGPGSMQQLIDMLVPEELPVGGLAGGLVMKPKTAMKDLATEGMKRYDKDAMSKAIGESMNATPLWKQKLKKP